MSGQSKLLLFLSEEPQTSFSPNEHPRPSGGIPGAPCEQTALISGSAGLDWCGVFFVVASERRESFTFFFFSRIHTKSALVHPRIPRIAGSGLGPGLGTPKGRGRGSEGLRTHLPRGETLGKEFPRWERKNPPAGA